MLTPDIAEKIDKTRTYLEQQNVSLAVEAATFARAILSEVMQILKPGIRESEVKQYALDCFARNGIERTWHPPYVRFGSHTLLTFQQRATDDLVLQESDIAFIDLGIVRDGIEGDVGDSIAFGDNSEHHRLVSAAKEIFAEAVAYWKRVNPTGIALYEYILNLAENHDVRWNLDPAGHLIGAFPHRGWKRGINTYPETIDAGKWILEIQIRHKEFDFGAFYEDLLV
jgi:Xaa-Pro aminopeptidase